MRFLLLCVAMESLGVDQSAHWRHSNRRGVSKHGKEISTTALWKHPPSKAGDCAQTTAMGAARSLY